MGKWRAGGGKAENEKFSSPGVEGEERAVGERKGREEGGGVKAVME